jgi:hypothetical protein
MPTLHLQLYGNSSQYDAGGNYAVRLSRVLNVDRLVLKKYSIHLLKNLFNDIKRIEVDVPWAKHITYNLADNTTSLTLPVLNQTVGTADGITVQEVDYHIGSRNVEIPHGFTMKLYSVDVASQTLTALPKTATWEVNLWFEYSESLIF